MAACPTAAERKGKADERWKRSRSTKAMSQVVATLEAMNGPLGTHCMYCEYNEARTIDHFEPRHSDPLLTFAWDNLHWCCDVCNGSKLDNFTRASDECRPLSPCQDFPSLHLKMLPDGGIACHTARAEWSVELFALARAALRTARRHRWTTLQHLIPVYHACYGVDRDKADEIADTIQRGRFRSVLRDLVAAALGPKAALLDLAAVRGALEARPEIIEWAGLAP